MKTIYSLPEYKFLNSVIKKNISPKYEPIIVFYPDTYGRILLAVGPKYRGNCITSTPNDKEPIFKIGDQLYASEIRDKFIDIYNFLYGVQIGAGYAKVDTMIFYIWQNPMFKHNLDFFKMLFERAATCPIGSSIDIYFKQLYKKSCDIINEPYAFRAINRYSYSFEKLMICNDLAIAS